MKHLSVIIIFCLLIVGCTKNDSSINAGDEPINPDAPAKPLTSKFNYDSILTYVSALGTGYNLSDISSTNVTSEGKATDWAYMYRKVDPATAIESLCYMHSRNDTVQFDSTITRLGPRLEWWAISSKMWINSDVALSIAEKNGGKQFREKNQNYTIRASLGSRVPSMSPWWGVGYSSTIDKNIHFNIRVNALTGVAEAINE
jgi:hypothetical protein